MAKKPTEILKIVRNILRVVILVPYFISFGAINIHVALVVLPIAIFGFYLAFELVASLVDYALKESARRRDQPKTKLPRFPNDPPLLDLCAMKDDKLDRYLYWPKT